MVTSWQPQTWRNDGALLRMLALPAAPEEATAWRMLKPLGERAPKESLDRVHTIYIREKGRGLLWSAVFVGPVLCAQRLAGEGQGEQSCVRAMIEEVDHAILKPLKLHAQTLVLSTGAITLVSSDLMGVAHAIALSRAMMRKIEQNLFWAFFYNVLLIPVAMLGWVPMIAAAAAMALSDVFVIGNALLLKRVKL